MVSAGVLGQYLPGNSPLHRLDPRTKILLVTAFSVLGLMVAGPWQFLLAAGTLATAVSAGQVPVRLTLRAMRPVLVFSAATLILSAWVTPLEAGEVPLQLGPLHISPTGVRIGLLAMARLTLLMLSAAVLTFTTSPIALTDGLERLLRPLKAVGVPAHELALMMTIALRFVPTLADEGERITRAQESRGGGGRSGGIAGRLQAMLPVLVPLFVSAFRRADELATAMEARGYRGGHGRTRMTELRLGWRDVVAFALMAAAMAAFFWLRLSGVK